MIKFNDIPAGLSNTQLQNAEILREGLKYASYEEEGFLHWHNGEVVLKEDIQAAFVDVEGVKVGVADVVYATR